MRFALALALLVPLACGDTSDDTSSSSSTGNASCTAGVGDGPDVDPAFPPCECSPNYCTEGSACRFTGVGQENWTSSICLPPCKEDADCPTLSGVPTSCDGEYCSLYCNPEKDRNCPFGYVCSPGLYCEAKH